MHILITGVSGFIGQALAADLKDRSGAFVRGVVRRLPEHLQEQGLFQVVGLGPETDWREALSGIDVVVHAAARVHVMDAATHDPLAEFRCVNVDGTLNLARQAVDARVRRFIYISSIKVNGEETVLDMPYTADDAPSPRDPYAISKHEAEEGLRQLAAATGLEVVIIRPPLVYGPGVKANFLTMMHWLYRGIPLPLGAVHNKRSLVALENLVDLIITCINHPAAANQVFLAGDGKDLSTPELLRGLADALGKPARLIPVPMTWLAAGAAVLGKRDIYQRLCGSLQVDISKARKLLDWCPPVSVEMALRTTAWNYLESHRVR